MMDCRYSNTPTKGNYKLNVVEGIKPHPVKEKLIVAVKQIATIPDRNSFLPL